MPPRGIHNPAGHNRTRVFEYARRDSTGSAFSSFNDAFHPPFPDSVSEYISGPCEVDREGLTRGRPGSSNICLDACPSHDNHLVHNVLSQVQCASASGHSAEIEGTSGAPHLHAEGHVDSLLFGTSGSILNLPREVSDLILSHLSPAALDAATHTCKDWRTKILSNTWVLSSVLGVNEGRSRVAGSPSAPLSHRDLLKKLDHDSALTSTFQHPDAWRTRFRTRTLDFSLPSPSSTRTRPALVAAARTGTQNGWLAFQLRDSAPEATNRLQSTLVIYRFDSAEIPWYAGAVHNVEGQGALRIISVAEIRRDKEWVLRIEIGGTAGFYSLNAREAFSNSDCRFSLKTLEILETVPGSLEDKSTVQGFDTLPEPLPTGDQSWKILAGFPPNEGPRHICLADGLRRHAEPRFLAEQRKTGNIYVVMEVGPSEKPSPYASHSQSKSLSNGFKSDNHRFAGIAFLSCSRPNSVYKNVAVAPTAITDGSIRVAIVWQTADLEKPISELYIYDISKAVYYDSCRTYDQNISDSVCTTLEGISEPTISRSCRLVWGKRVTSLDQHMGGIHTSNPLCQLASLPEIVMGGLQIPHTTENQEAYPRNVRYQKCFVWGPATSGRECTRISLKVFDLSFTDQQRMRSLMTYRVGSGWRRDKMFHNITLNAFHCACALHDDGFQIVLPDTTSAEASELATERDNTSSSLQRTATLKESLSSLNESPWPFWPQEATSSAPDSVQNVGSVSSNDSLARRTALKRRQEWLRGRIAGMKRVGLTDFEIAELWNMSSWTQYGQVRKPEGWQELG